MNEITIEYNSNLCAESIDIISDKIKDSLSELKLQKRDILRYAMTVEEILLESEKECGNAPVRLIIDKRRNHCFITLEIYGKSINVFATQNSPRGAFNDGILKNLGLSPEYRYSNECNIYSFNIKHKQKNDFIPLVIAIASAIIIGMLGSIFPGNTRDVLLNNIIDPLNDAFLIVLGCISSPMIFLSVAWGIYGIGDALTFKKIGKKLCINYISTVLFSILIIGLVVFPFFSLNFSANSNGVSTLSSLPALLINIIPHDIFSPFINGNTLQIITLAVVIGIAMLFLRQKIDVIAKSVEQINYIVMLLVRIISRFIPYFIFIVLLKIIWTETLDTFAGIGKFFIIFLFGVLLFQIILIGYTALRNKIKPSQLVKKGLPTLLIAMTTASSAAAFETNIKACHEGYGIDKKLCSFGVPLGIVLNRPSLAIGLIVQAMFFAELYSVEISASWLLILLVNALLLTISSPPIPGGAMAVYAVLFAQLGIPQEALAIALACDRVLDFIRTGFNQFDIQLVLLNTAEKHGLVDHEKLLK